jgi:hypothetical protein
MLPPSVIETAPSPFGLIVVAPVLVLAGFTSRYFG